MSTRCLVGIKRDSGDIEYIYVHHDGYVKGVGMTLKEYYSDEAAINYLLDLGDLSALGTYPKSNKDLWDLDKFFNVSQKDREKFCISYKDRGETNVDSKFAQDEDSFIDKGNDFGVDYLYLFEDNSWKVYDMYGKNGFVDF